MTPELADKNSCVVVYDSHEQAEKAIGDLTAAGFDTSKISVLGPGLHPGEKVMGYYDAGNRVKTWGLEGGFWGALLGLLGGAGLFWIPAFGPLMVSGPIASAIVGAVEGFAVVGGLSALGAALVSIAVPPERAEQYEADLKSGKYLLVLHGSPEEVADAARILGRDPACQVETHLAASDTA